MLMWLGTAWAGGGPQNVMVLYNAEVPDAESVAAHYADVRDLPAGHRCGLSGIAEDETELSLGDYTAWVLSPLEDCLSALPQPEDIDYLVVVRGLPYRVEAGDYTVSLSAALQVSRLPSPTGSGLVIDDGHPDGYAYIVNPYYNSGTVADFEDENDYASWYTSASGISRTRRQPAAFERDSLPANYGDHIFIVTRLDGFDYQDARDIVDRGAAADGTFPSASFLCMHGADPARGARDPECAFAIQRLKDLGQAATWLPEFDGALSGHEVVAYFTGAAELRDGIDGLTYVPGAITCNLTSYGAKPQNFFCDDSGEVCPGNESQTSIARHIRAGATGAHGTVNEPYNNVFPNAGALLHYRLGYSLGESYFFNQRFLYWQNLIIGDPLATPFSERPTVTPPADSLPVGAELTASATHPDGVGEIRLYVDDRLVAAAAGDSLSWQPEGYAPGDTVTLRVVAESEDVEVPTPGWSQDEVLVRTRTQGWSLSTLSITKATAEDTAANTDSANPSPVDAVAGSEKNGCGGQAIVLVWLGLLLVGKRPGAQLESTRPSEVKTGVEDAH